MNTSRRYIGRLVLIPLLFLYCIPQVNAQLAGEDRNEQVTIVGSYDPTINQAYKINLKPEPVTFVTEKPEFTFQMMDVRQETDIEAAKIQPATIRADRRTTVYDNYLKVGFGSLITPLLDFYHSSGNRNDDRFNLKFHHLSSFKDIPDYAPGPFSNTDIDAGYEKHNGNSIFSLGIGYGLDTYRYYGFMTSEYPDINTDADSLKQSFNQIRANLGIRSNNRKEEAFQYAVNLNAYYYFDRWKSRETDLQLPFDLGKPFGISKNSNQKAGIKGLLRYGVNQDSLQTDSDMLLSGTPYYSARFGMVSFSLGVKVNYLEDDSTDFGIFPVIDVNVNLIPEVLTLYAGTDGGMHKNSFFELTQLNPWVSSAIPARWQMNKLKVYAGVRGNVSGQLGFNLELGWLRFENMPFFVNTGYNEGLPAAQPALKFDAAFDQGSLFSVNGEVQYTFNALKIWLHGAYNAYTLDSLPQPYYKPITEIGLGGSYLIKQKVKVWLQLFNIGKRHAPDTDQGNLVDVELDGFLDINAGVDFYATEKLTVFVNGTNLLNKNYMRYLNYPVQGLQVMGGVAYRF